MELEVVNLFGHTYDSIGIIDRMNKNFFTGYAIIEWHGENSSAKYFAEKYHETLIPDSTIHIYII